MATSKPVVLGVGEDRDAQSTIAQTFNQEGVFYRFITERRKLSGGISQLKPDLLLVFGELSSDFVIQVFDQLAADVASASLPVMVACVDRADEAFVTQMRTGVVALIEPELGPAQVRRVKATWEGLATRSGVGSGLGDGKGLTRLVELVRRTRRSGLLQTDPRSPAEGRVSFAKGRVDRASFQGLVSQNALKAVLVQGQVKWTFSELQGGAGEGSGVVIEVGDVNTGETEVSVSIDEELPIAAGSYEMPMPPPVKTPTPPPSAPTAKLPARLLLVDDDDALLHMFSTLFKKHGFEVTTATDGQVGAELSLQREFDVVLADLNMPRLDGWGLLRVLRDDFRTRELPLAFISAHDDYRESLKALDAGAQAYLSKGTRLDAVVNQLQKLLEPRNLALAELERRQPLHAAFAQLGPQWFLRQLDARKATGSLEARDGWASYTLMVEHGAVVHALALAGTYTAEGERAFNAFVASRAAEGSWTWGKLAAPGKSLFHPTAVLLERACATLNGNEQRMRDNLMVSATTIDVNAELYAVYRQVGPKQWLEAARLICEEKLPPRDVIARIDTSPIEVEETMKDLIRRGVVSLKKG